MLSFNGLDVNVSVNKQSCLILSPKHHLRKLFIMEKFMFTTLIIFKIGEFLCSVQDPDLIGCPIIKLTKDRKHGGQIQLELLTHMENNWYMDYTLYFWINLCHTQLQCLRSGKKCNCYCHLYTIWAEIVAGVNHFSTCSITEILWIVALPKKIGRGLHYCRYLTKCVKSRLSVVNMFTRLYW